jgi:hypothetical protein
MKLSQKQKRVKLAEARGWIFKPQEFGWNFTKLDPTSYWIKYRKGEEPFPDYFNDLNACHEAETALSATQRPKYVTLLCSLTSDRDGEGLVFASAPQRAEALGQTLNLW